MREKEEEEEERGQEGNNRKGGKSNRINTRGDRDGERCVGEKKEKAHRRKRKKNGRGGKAASYKRPTGGSNATFGCSAP